MKLHIVHQTEYRYDEPAYLITQALRMWPQSTSGQRVGTWNVEVDGHALRPTCRDGFGNAVASHTIDSDVDGVRLSVRGEVETEDLHGVYGIGDEVLPPVFYLFPTALTGATEGISELAQSAAGKGGDDVERLHRLSNAVRDRVDYLAYQTDAETTAAEAFKAGVGVCQDHAHILIAAARSLDYPARYVSGYLCATGEGAAASHAWAEVFVEHLGWVGFDAANRQSPDEKYVRVACGRDYRDAAPVRGVRLGGIAETLDVDVSIIEHTPAGSRSPTQ